MNLFKNIGPATLVTAAFIGPGTVTICTIAGANFGFSLLWAMGFSVLATIGLQEMSARLGIVSGTGLASIIGRSENPLLKLASISLIVSAIVIGNLAYEAGNISGGMLGLQLLIPHSQFNIGSISINYLSIFLGAVAFVLLYVGNYRSLERILVVSVIIMSLSFIVSAMLTKPSLSEVFSGMLIPSVSGENILTVVALVGTTVVPYNLFLHSSLVSQKWDVSNLKNSRIDTIVAVVIGGIISMAIIISASATNNPDVTNATDLAHTLEPVFGRLSKYLIGFGLLSAGLSSAITAPLAAAFVAKECFNWSGDSKSMKFRLTWMLILIPGSIFSSVGIKPVFIIQFAQLINGILLPVAAGFLLWTVNNHNIMKGYANSKVQNMIGILIFIITLFLGIKGILKVLTII